MWAFAYFVQTDVRRRPIFASKTIGEVFTSRDNRLTLIRIALATAVLIEHAIIVTQGPEFPPPLAINGWSLSYAAVNAFFILSGFLIADSLERRRDPFEFAVARALRLLPALIALSIAAILIVGPAVTDLGWREYWASTQTWFYPINVLGFLDTSQGPAGIFSDNPWAGEFSAPLWTLRYEVIAYVGAALLFFSPWPWGRLGHLGIFVLTVTGHVLISVYWPEAPALVQSAARLSAAFTLGMVVHGWRHRIPVLPYPVFVALPLWLVLGSSPLAEVFMNLAIGSVMFAIGFFGLGRWPTGADIPDWSYGIYIWHYPVMQIVLFADPAADPVKIGMVAVPVTLAVSALSWTFVERPSLSLKPKCGDMLRAAFRGRNFKL